jgi:hypothetical protein
MGLEKFQQRGYSSLTFYAFSFQGHLNRLTTFQKELIIRNKSAGEVLRLI